MARRAVALVAVASLGLAGCGGADGGNNASGRDLDTSAVLDWGVDWSDGYTVIDPLDQQLRISTSQASNWVDLIYDAMIHDGPDGLQPGLALSWKTPDSRTIDLTLREGVKFHDGTDFNAEAVKFSWDRLIALGPQKLNSLEYRAMESVEVTGPYAVRLNLGADVAYGMIQRAMTTATTLAVVSPTAVKKYGDDFRAHAVGAGPYRLSGLVDGEKVSLTKVADNWDADRYRFAGINFIQTENGAATSIALRSGAIDGAYLISSSDVPALKQAGLRVVSKPSNTGGFMNMCATRGPLADPEVRRAVIKGIDLKAINRAVYQDLGTETLFPTPTGIEYAKDLAAPLAFDREAAKKIIADKGLTGTTIRMIGNISSFTGVEAVATVVQAQLREIGLNMTYRSIENGHVVAAAEKPELYMAASGPFTLPNFLGLKGQHNVCQNDFPEVERLRLAAFDVSKSDAELTAAWRDLQGEVFKNLPAVWLLQHPQVVATAANVRGPDYIHINGTQRSPSFKGVGVVKR